MAQAKELYNFLLKKAEEKYATTKKTLTKFEMNKLLPELKKEKPEFNYAHSQVLQNVSDRVYKAYANFFLRVKRKKNGEKIKAGYPRFKKFVRSLTYPQSGFKFLNERRIELSKIGVLPIVLHRVPKGKIKTCAIKMNKAGEWFVIISCEQEDITFQSNEKPAVGLDLGLMSYAVLSNGSRIENPCWLRKSQNKLRKAQRKLSRRKKGSRNRGKAKWNVARIHERIANRRNDFLHKETVKLVNTYSVLALEDLKTNSMLKNHKLAGSIQDASWSKFANILSYKASSAGCRAVFVNPKNTTKKCSNCGNLKEVTLAERIYNCPICKMSMDRDLNAAKNIITTAGLAGSHAFGENVRLHENEAVLNELGTTY